MRPPRTRASRRSSLPSRSLREAAAADAEGERRRQRAIPIHPAFPAFAEYYATHVPLAEQAVFVGVQGKPLTYTQLGQAFRHYVDATGVNERKRVTPYTLRHVLASELLHAGPKLRQIQELLGHNHLDSTQRYTRVNAHELRGAIRRLRWVG